MSHVEHKAHGVRSVRVYAVTVSDTRTEATDTSGKLLRERLVTAGHEVVGAAIVRDEPTQIEARLSDAAVAGAQVVILSGGTGLSRRDSTPDTLTRLFERELPGFGELFRFLSYAEIGAAAMLSRATAGTYRGMIVFSIPGSQAAARLAMEKLILPELAHVVREMTKDQA